MFKYYFILILLGLSCSSSNPVEVPAPDAAPDIIHLISDGQSLSLGSFGNSRGNTATTNTPEPYVIGFKKGPRMINFEADVTKYSSFVPLVEDLPGGGNQQTPVSTMARMFKQMVEAEFSSTCDTCKLPEILGSAPGTPSAGIETLQKGGVSYQRTIDGFTNGKRLADAAGKDYASAATLWMQGEANYFASRSLYRKEFMKRCADIIADVKLINPSQKRNHFFVTYQLASHNVAGKGAGAYPNVALAQLDIALNEKDVFMGPTMYHYDYAPDQVHLSGAKSYMEIGAIAGYIMFEVLIKGVDWRPIHVLSHSVQDNILQVNFHVPMGKLSLDTVTVSNPGHYGFRLFSGKTEQKLISVQVVGSDAVRIVAERPIAPGMKLTYAINGIAGKTGREQGSRGCLRDTQGESVVFDPFGYNIALHNWCPIFELSI